MKSTRPGYLKIYIGKTEEHLRSLLLSKFWDRRLATSREQYHLYMLEIKWYEPQSKLWTQKTVQAPRNRIPAIRDELGVAN
jgi:hypothetical protein